MTSAQLKAMTPDDGVTNSQSLCAPGAHVVGVLPVAWVMFRYLEPIPASRGGSAALLNGHPVIAAPSAGGRVRFAPPVVAWLASSRSHLCLSNCSWMVD
jgi:hypothetical protein